MKKKKRKAGGDRKRSSRTLAYPVEFLLRIVKLFLEEGYSASLIKLGARLIKELDKKLKQVETDVRDAFKELEGDLENWGLGK